MQGKPFTQKESYFSEDAEQDELLVSSLSGESFLQSTQQNFKAGQEQTKTQTLPHNRNQSIENVVQTHKKTTSRDQFKYNSVQTDKQLKTLELLYQSKVHDLESYNNQLHIQLQFAKEQNAMLEIECQQKILSMQKQHDDIINLIKRKYHMQSERTKQKLQDKDNQIQQLATLLHQMKAENKTPLSTVRRSPIQISQNTSSRQIENYHSQSQRCQSVTEVDQKLLSMYQKEIDKLKHQTQTYEQKFIKEKETILAEIEKMKTQKSFIEKIIGKRGPSYIQNEGRSKSTTRNQINNLYQYN